MSPTRAIALAFGIAASALGCAPASRPAASATATTDVAPASVSRPVATVAPSRVARALAVDPYAGLPSQPKPSVRWVPSPNYDERPASTRIDTLVIHDTESPGIRKAMTIATMVFANRHEQASAHYVIGKAGEIVQCVDDRKRAWHAGPSRYLGRGHVNDFAIGIELVNDQTGHDPFTDAQYRSLVDLSAYLLRTYGIPIDRITGHRHITLYPQYRKDPANNFDWNRYLEALQAKLGVHTALRIPTREQAQFGTAEVAGR